MERGFAIDRVVGDTPELEPPPLGRHVHPDDACVIQRVHVLRCRRELNELGISPFPSIRSRCSGRRLSWTIDGGVLLDDLG